MHPVFTPCVKIDVFSRISRVWRAVGLKWSPSVIFNDSWCCVSFFQMAKQLDPWSFVSACLKTL